MPKQLVFLLPLLLLSMLCSCGQEVTIETKEALLERIAKSETFIAQKETMRAHLEIIRSYELDLLALDEFLENNKDDQGRIESWEIVENFPGAKEYLLASHEFTQARKAFDQEFPEFKNFSKEDRVNTLLLSDAHTGYSPSKFITPTN